MSEKKSDLIRENNELRAENRELRKFVNYVRWLKTDEEFINLRKLLEKANFILKENQEWEAE